MVLLLVRTYVNNFFQDGYPLSMVFATLFTRDAKTLAISDAVLVCSTFVCVPFVKALQKGYIRYYYTGQTILHIYQMITLALAIQWTFNREWPWVQSGFFTLHTLVMLMKTYSYVATNGYLSDLARRRALTEDQLHKSVELVGGYEAALAEAKQASPQSPGTQSVTPIGTPLSDKEVSLDQTKLRQRLNSTEPVKKEENTSRPKSSSYFPTGDAPALPPHPLINHPSPNIAVLAQNLTDMDLELTSTGKNRIRYPNNISYANFLDFQMLCYELEYPRTERIRPMYIFEKTVATFEHYIIPLTPTPDQSFARSMLDLALPFMASVQFTGRRTLRHVPILRARLPHPPSSFLTTASPRFRAHPFSTGRQFQIPISSTPPTKDGKETTEKKTLHENIYTIPNALTVSRILACPVLGWAILEGRYGLATGLLFYAGVTDWVDGYIARKWDMRTVLGTILDPAADKTLMTTLTSLWRYISLPPPKTFERYWDFSIPSAEVRPTQISKYNTFLQLSLMGVTTIAPIIPFDLSMQLSALQLTVAVTTVWSGLSYVFSKDAVKILSSNRPPKP
ncbi:unnamed protein product [Rhizoctonia solani]|uniref:Uncharacterized protein n=1 Tax=Rhizoctonia solani TaxID=456999 RepID=A0A8H3CVX1_9AGAM|nr:unnamed protein product [Rhizoctonia solani]